MTLILSLCLKRIQATRSDINTKISSVLTCSFSLDSRYLRARKFNPEEAFGQFKDTEDWRKENRLEEYYDQIDIREYDEARRLVSSGSSMIPVI